MLIYMFKKYWTFLLNNIYTSYILKKKFYIFHFIYILLIAIVFTLYLANKNIYIYIYHYSMIFCPYKTPEKKTLLSMA